jgi:hypothetical protein
LAAAFTLAMSISSFASPLYFTGAVQTTGTIGRMAPPIIASLKYWA